MKGKVVLFSLFALLLLVAAAAPALATQPKTWTEKNNDKFQTFEVSAITNFGALFGGDWEYTPSVENPNKLVISWNEVMTAYEIRVDGNTYELGTDFTYAGRFTFTFYDPVITGPHTIPTEARAEHLQVDYVYDFSAVPGGIDGTIRMQAIMKEGAFSISSLAGTGDLQNVQIKATSIPTPLPNLVHEGIVSGWPE